MKKTIKITLVALTFAFLGFGITPEAQSETAMLQTLPCWKKKGRVHLVMGVPRYETNEGNIMTVPFYLGQ